MTPRPSVAGGSAVLAILAALGGACSSTGEPGHTAAVDVVRVDADGVTQTVVPMADGFDRVTVTTATFGDSDGVDGTLELEVAGPGGERRAAARGTDLADNAPLTLAFEPFEASADRTFELTFRYAGEAPVALYRNPFDPYGDGELRPAGGDLVFSLGHADRVGGATSALGRVVRETSAIATGDPWFLAVWALALAGLVAAGVRLRRPAGDRAGSSR